MLDPFGFAAQDAVADEAAYAYFDELRAFHENDEEQRYPAHLECDPITGEVPE